jgi:hypothetical protein
VRRAKPGPKLRRAVSLPFAGDVPPALLVDRRSDPLPTWDWESKILAHLQENNRSTLAEVIDRFTRTEPVERRGELAQEVRLALRSLGEKCCVFVEAGGRYCAAV